MTETASCGIKIITGFKYTIYKLGLLLCEPLFYCFDSKFRIFSLSLLKNKISFMQIILTGSKWIIWFIDWRLNRFTRQIRKNRHDSWTRALINLIILSNKLFKHVSRVMIRMRAKKEMLVVVVECQWIWMEISHCQCTLLSCDNIDRPNPHS